MSESDEHKMALSQLLQNVDASIRVLDGESEADLSYLNSQRERLLRPGSELWYSPKPAPKSRRVTDSIPLRAQSMSAAERTANAKEVGAGMSQSKILINAIVGALTTIIIAAIAAYTSGIK